MFLDNHGILDLKRGSGTRLQNDTAGFLWTLSETIGKRGWHIAILSKAENKRASETVEWLAGMQALQYFSQIVFTADRTSNGTCKAWPGKMRRFEYWSPEAACYDGAECVWYPGGKDDYLAGYQATFPDKALILVDDGDDILRAACTRVHGLRTVRVSPWDVGPAPLADTHENARDLFSLVQKLQAMARAAT